MRRSAARRLTLLIACLAAMLLFSVGLIAAGALFQSRADPPPARVILPAKPMATFARIQTWIALAKAHRIGHIDEPLKTVASWPAAELRLVDQDLLLVQLVIAAAAKSIPGARNTAGRSLSLMELPALFDEPLDLFMPQETLPDLRFLVRPDGPTRLAIARIMVQGAMLQTDLIAAMSQGGTESGVQPARVPTTTVRVADADRTNVADLNAFWAVAREAMDLAAPTPWGAPLAHDWYLVTGEDRLSHRDYAVGLAHLEHARDTVPGEAKLALYLGAVYENMAAPGIQAALQGTETSMLGPRPVLLNKAEFQLRSALLLDPHLTDAALRLGRTLQLMGRNAEALPLLTRAEGAIALPELKYYAALFTGLAHEAQGHDDDARAAFGRASGLFPDAQTPQLALAQLTLRTSSQREALPFVQTLGTAAGVPDPWWTYDIALTAGAAERFASFRDTVTEKLR